MDDMIERLFQLRKQRAELDDEITELSAAIAAMYAEESRFTAGRYSVTVTHPSRLTVDLAQLASVAAPELFDSVTKTVIDTESFRAAIDDGLVSDQIIRTAVSLVPTKPVVRIKEVSHVGVA